MTVCDCVCVGLYVIMCVDVYHCGCVCVGLCVFIVVCTHTHVSFVSVDLGTCIKK